MKWREIKRLIRADDGPPRAVEAIGVARANLAFALGDDPLIDTLQDKVILVTSAIPGEGKSVTAAALARSLAQAGKRVVLVDADLRRPSQNRLFNTKVTHGLADVLAGDRKLDDVLVASNLSGLTLLYSGYATRNPGDLLSLPGFGETIATLRDRADVIVVDAPTAMMVPDVLYMTRYVDCILHVVGSGQVQRSLFLESAETLEAASKKPILFFVNRAPQGRSKAFSSYYVRNRNGNGKGGGIQSGPNLPAIAADAAPAGQRTDV
jgi:capsular exopolysaccharide synthesis family protein